MRFDIELDDGCSVSELLMLHVDSQSVSSRFSAANVFNLVFDFSYSNSIDQLGFFFQAEEGIRDHCVTGFQTCPLFFSSRRRHTRSLCDWSSDVCSSDLKQKTAYEITV